MDFHIEAGPDTPAVGHRVLQRLAAARVLPIVGAWRPHGSLLATLLSPIAPRLPILPPHWRSAQANPHVLRERALIAEALRQGGTVSDPSLHPSLRSPPLYPFSASLALNTPEAVEEFLKDAAEQGDPEYAARARALCDNPEWVAQRSYPSVWTMRGLLRWWSR